MRIGDLARMAGTSTRAIRHYHRVGVLPEPPRSANGYRRYALDDLVRVVRIRWLLASGLSLREAASALDEEAGSGLVGQVRAALDRVTEERERLAQQEVTLREILRQVEAGRSPSAVADDVSEWLDVVVTTVVADGELAATERAAVELFAHTGAADDDAQGALADSYRRMASEPHLAAALTDLSARLDALTGKRPADVADEIAEAAALLESVLDDVGTDDLVAALGAVSGVAGGGPADVDDAPDAAPDDAPDDGVGAAAADGTPADAHGAERDGAWLDALFPDPAHRAVIARVARRWSR